MLENDECSLTVDDGEFECEDSTGSVVSDSAEEFNRRYETAPIDDPAAEQANKWALKDRLRSKVLWASLVGALMDLFTALGLWDKIGVTSVRVQAVIAAIGTILVAFGILNNPTDREAF